MCLEWRRRDVGKLEKYLGDKIEVNGFSVLSNK